MTSTPSTTSRIHATAIENAFPTPPAGDNAQEGAFDLKGRMSPSPHKFSLLQRAQSTPPELTHSNQFTLLAKNSKGQPSDLASLEQSWSRLRLSKKRSQYYDDAFAYRESNNTAKERVAKDWVILAEVKLNCCLESEKGFLIDLSFRLSEIYQRPASCIMVMVTTDIPILLGGNSEPAYHLTITALASEIAATKNKRSTHLIQDFIHDTLQIPPKRGVVRFDAVTEENLATNGMTALQEIEQLERRSNDEDVHQNLYFFVFPYPPLPQSLKNMDLSQHAKHYRLLGLRDDASLEELDERYFELTEYWTMRSENSESKLELHLIDEAYKALLSRFLGEGEETRRMTTRPYTMKEVVQGQDRITRSCLDNGEMWNPLREKRSPSFEFEDIADRLRAEAAERDENCSGSAPGFSISDLAGDLDDAPDRAVIVHAVNCQGAWGYGVALYLKRLCPQAFRIYQEHCETADRPYDLIGTCLLIPPQPLDYEQEIMIKLKGTNKTIPTGDVVCRPRRWIACLFTSIGYGKPNMKTNNPGKDSTTKIIPHTRMALEELRVQLEAFGPSNFSPTTAWHTDRNKPGEIWSPKFNSGAFGVDWEDTRMLITEEFKGFERPWTVVEKANGTEKGSTPDRKGDVDL
ncbi:hypothetical protein AYL99_00213 [Fonsecaea erecta]|uniref:L-dopachrome isomerase n=1 Tax=Fonsecaea erecta TaxID=1367422 RepID=A0A178ZXT4_9EURO|nr:hypothetical protein AYL99_00213 [Fonsecaea erecta]OAP64241.1 hypothetical protein AYL99_00213 [Fonsecaea erecta]